MAINSKCSLSPFYIIIINIYTSYVNKNSLLLYIYMVERLYHGVDAADFLDFPELLLTILSTSPFTDLRKSMPLFGTIFFDDCLDLCFICDRMPTRS